MDYVCPRCVGKLELADAFLHCTQCKLDYPVVDGVPYLVFYGEDWYLKLREVVLYRDFCAKLKSGAVERDRIAAHQQTGATLFKNLTAYFEQATSQVDFSRAPRILDVGAGCGEVSQKFAERGAQVWAVDMNLFDLHDDVRWMAFADLEGKDFYQILRGTPMTTPLFQRAIADADYLPFPDAFFDYVVLRAVAHHLFDLPRFMREANRVLKPGGQLLLIAEPLASVLDRAAEYSEGDLDYEEGMHETRPYFYKYRRGLKAGGFGQTQVQCYYISLGFRALRWMNRLRIPGDLNAWLPKRIVHGPLSVLLSLTAGCMNLYARKLRDVPSGHRQTLPNTVPSSAAADVLVQLRKDPAVAKRILRQFVPADLLLSELELADQNVNRLAVRGVRAPEVISGKTGRYLLSSFTAYLKNPNGCTHLQLEYCADVMSDLSPEIQLNEVPLTLKLERGGWKHITLPVQCAERVIELCIEQPQITGAQSATTTRDIGLALRSLRLRRPQD
ncbi:MAG: methyltransferase domain-containing protein [Candidatus Sumerlaeaceae bacterium]